MRLSVKFLEKTARLSFLLFLVFLPLNLKKFILPFNRGLDDFQGIFIYASDIFLFLFLISFLFLWPDCREKIKLLRFGQIILIVLLVLIGLSIFQANELVPAFYGFVRLLLMITGSLVLAVFLRTGFLNIKEIAVVVAGSAVFQSLLGFYQFIFSKSLGLWWLGEPIVEKFTRGMARFVVDGQVFLRAFGTLPHANIFAGYLVLGLLALGYLWLIRPKKNISISVLLGLSLFSVIVGLGVSFSRSGWLSAIVGMIVFLISAFQQKEIRKEILSLAVLLLVIISLLLVQLGWLFLPRAGFSLTEVSVADRLTYNKIGLEILKNNPLGVGIGNQAFYAADQGFYQAAGLSRPTLWQPIHNLYLLIGTEIGWLGLMLFLIFIGWLGFLIWRQPNEPERSFVLAALAALLFFGLFDHFLWDLQSGVLMFWLAIGIMMSEVFEGS